MQLTVRDFVGPNDSASSQVFSSSNDETNDPNTTMNAPVVNQELQDERQLGKESSERSYSSEDDALKIPTAQKHQQDEAASAVTKGDEAADAPIKDSVGTCDETLNESSKSVENDLDEVSSAAARRLRLSIYNSVWEAVRHDSLLVNQARFGMELTDNELYLTKVTNPRDMSEDVIEELCSALSAYKQCSRAVSVSLLSSLHKWIKAGYETDYVRLANSVLEFFDDELKEHLVVNEPLPSSRHPHRRTESYDDRSDDLISMAKQQKQNLQCLFVEWLQLCVMIVEHLDDTETVIKVWEACWETCTRTSLSWLETVALKAMKDICVSLKSSRETICRILSEQLLESDSMKAMQLLSTILEMENIDCDETPKAIVAHALRSEQRIQLSDSLRLWMQVMESKPYKCEFEVLIYAVVLRRLQETNNPEEQEVCIDFLHTLLVEYWQDIYLNFDCVVGSSNMLESIIETLSQAAYPYIPEEEPEPKQNAKKLDREVSCDSTVSVQTTSSETPPPCGGGVATVPASAEVSSAVSVKPSVVTVDPSAPLNHLNRLALEALLDFLECLEKPVDLRNTLFGAAEEISVAESIARKHRKQSLAKVAESFNIGNPDKGDFLVVAVTEAILQPGENTSGEAVAALLRKTPGLDKRKLGEYLSRGPEKKFPFHASVRSHFCAQHDFVGLSFSVALRKFLSKFHLPGEAQCIDRLMEVLSKTLYEHQADSAIFKNSDAVYVLAFSAIMLNTDLHNPTIKADRRMTREQFVKNTRGINGGDDLPEDFLTDLYEQIKKRELLVRKDATDFMREKDSDFQTAWEDVSARKAETAPPVIASIAGSEHEPDIFGILAKTAVRSVFGVFAKSWDDRLVVRALRGLETIVQKAAVLQMDTVVDEILSQLLSQGSEYITKSIELDANEFDAETLHRSMQFRSQSSFGESESVEDETTTAAADTEHTIPVGMLCSSPNATVSDYLGCASNRGLLALDRGFVLLRKNQECATTSWSAFIQCLCALRDARALPTGLSELDDFADSDGNVLPRTTFAKASKKRFEDHRKSLQDKENTRGKGWFRGLFRNRRAIEPSESSEDNTESQPEELALYGRTLADLAKAADVEEIVQMGSSQLPDETVQLLLDSLDAFPFHDDPVGEQHAVFSLELAARSLLSTSGRSGEVFLPFLMKFESVLCRIDNQAEKVPAPFVVERIVVTILRSCIHLYESKEIRPHLRASLQLLTMTIPRHFIRAIADRMACGLAIILRSSFPCFESQEWTFMGDTLDTLANYAPSRVFVFDGIASTVEFALPKFDPLSCDDSYTCMSEDEDDRPPLSIEACVTLSRILTRFVLGFYQNDLSLTVPAMLCLEKVYRHKSAIMLFEEATRDGTDAPTVSPVSSVPDKDFWQNVAVAVYSVCRSTDSEVSTEALQCFRRIILQTDVDQIPGEKWMAIMYLMVNKQPSATAEISRGNCFSVLGQLFVRVLPTISKLEGERDDLEDLVLQFAALAEENLEQNRRGKLFEKTQQTLTYLSSNLTSNQYQGDKEFSKWTNKTLLKELDKVGARVCHKPVTTANAKEVEDVSEISDSAVDSENEDSLGESP